jgi:aerobic carbon-monoxide dehydrogenase large subunit
MSIVGTRVVRAEDPRLLTAGANYVDDLCVPELTGALRVTFVRSPLAHALVTGIDVSAARDQPGVVAVLTAKDLDDLPAPRDAPMAEPLLAADRVRFAGEPVAIVVTADAYQGEDAAELVSVDYEPLAAVIDFSDALDGRTLLFPAAGSNIAGTGGTDSYADAAFNHCEVVVERTIVNQRVAPVPLEVRAAAAVWDSTAPAQTQAADGAEPAAGHLTFWASTQNAQLTRLIVAGALGLDMSAVRVITPDVGGGFGAKVGVDRDVIAVAWAARKLGRSLRWVETRTENLLAMTHGRAQQQAIKIGGTRDGRVLAYRLDTVQDGGAFPRLGQFLASLTMMMSGGPYDIPNVQAGYRVIVTNTTPISAYRGAGRPEATAAIERAFDLFAAEIGMDPAELRRRNLVAADKFPYTAASGAVYDTGEYVEALDRVLAAAGYGELRAEQARRRERGDTVQLGIGVASYVEITAADAAAGETARLVVHGDGTATVLTGSSPHGQGHATAWSMLVQEELGIPMSQVTVLHGDTDLIPKGVGTYASRSLQLGGAAVHQAAVDVKEQARKVAAGMLEASDTDLVLDAEQGIWQVRGDPATGLSWAQVAGRAGPEGLAADVEFAPGRPTFPFGAHVAVVEVDTETGKVRLMRHVTVDDAGPVFNPVLAEGQRHGGIAQGAAQALLEEVAYDADGNPLTSTLADYAAITAAELPSFELVEMETPTDINPLGVKGIGEAGTIGSIPSVQNAVIDAVAHLGVRHIPMPATPQRVWTAISEARAGQ